MQQLYCKKFFMLTFGIWNTKSLAIGTVEPPSLFVFFSLFFSKQQCQHVCPPLYQSSRNGNGIPNMFQPQRNTQEGGQNIKDDFVSFCVQALSFPSRALVISASLAKYLSTRHRKMPTRRNKAKKLSGQVVLALIVIPFWCYGVKGQEVTWLQPAYQITHVFKESR